MNPCDNCKRPATVKCCHNCKKDAADCNVWHDCGKDCPGWKKPTQTNADRIIGELAETLSGMCKIAEQCDYCPMEGNCPGGSYDLGVWMKWLKQPAEE